MQRKTITSVSAFRMRFCGRSSIGIRPRRPNMLPESPLISSAILSVLEGKVLNYTDSKRIIRRRTGVVDYFFSKKSDSKLKEVRIIVTPELFTPLIWMLPKLLFLISY